MKNIIPVMLCVLMLCACGNTSDTETIEIPDPPVRASQELSDASNGRFAFTEENYPKVDGSTATIPLIEAVESVLLDKPRTEINVSVSKTSGAYTALANGTADILFVYDGGDEIREELNADDIFDTVPIGKDALVFLVNTDNPVDNLTTEQVRKIFSGEYTNWSQVGGSDEPIRAYQRGEGSGSQALMDKLVMDGLSMADPAMVKVIGDMGGLVDAVADYAGGPNAIGYNVYFYVTEMKTNEFIKTLSIDGVEPTYESIQSGEYPFVSEFYSVIRKDESEDSPARALHEWMLTAEAQNLMASENYVALYADPDAETPRAQGSFSFYPEGEAPVYFKGSNIYALQPSDAYGELYFYLGSVRYEDFAVARFFGICNEDGKIVTEPVYTAATLLTDSEGNKAYFCYRSDLAQGGETITNGEWTYTRTVNPAILFSTDGSWVMEFDGAMPYYGFTVASDIIMNNDILAVKRDGKWGAVNMKGEIVIGFLYDSSDDIYPQRQNDEYYSYLGITGSRVARSADNDNVLYGGGPYNLYDENLNLVATGLPGIPEYRTGSFMVINTWSDGQLGPVYTYTLDGELIASKDYGAQLNYAQPFGDYVCVELDKTVLICDTHLNVIYEHEKTFYEENNYYTFYDLGENVFYGYDAETKLRRTYLPDGTLLVTWYDAELNWTYYY